jgi:hypothetical protein
MSSADPVDTRTCFCFRDLTEFRSTMPLAVNTAKKQGGRRIKLKCATPFDRIKAVNVRDAG